MLVLNSFHTTVEKALGEIDPKWRDYIGLVVCGTHTPQFVDGMINAIREYREAGHPILGICFGHQLAAVEYARNVLGIENASSEEWGHPTDTFVVRKRDGLKVGLHDGETYWNNYEVDPEFEKRWQKPENIITMQYHPEYQSSKSNPHPLLIKFIEHAKVAV